MLLVGISTVLTIVIGLWIGARAGWRRGSTVRSDLAPSSTMVLYATPEFFLGMLLLSFFAGRLGWFPTGGIRDVVRRLHGIRAVLDRLHHLVLPVPTLTLGYLGSYALVMRTSMLDTAGEDYLVTARAKGLRDNEVMRRHALPNALLPSVSLIAISFGFIIGGAITTETVFSYPGLGLPRPTRSRTTTCRCCRRSSCSRALAVVVFNLVADLAYGVLDPRVRRVA